MLNNRKQQLVNFDEELAKYPDKCWDMAKKSNYGSVKHMMSVQYSGSFCPTDFILVESDVLITKPSTSGMSNTPPAERCNGSVEGATRKTDSSPGSAT